MLRRACPRAQTPAGEDQRPRSSGPRWAMPDTIAATIRRSAGADQFTSPAIPHMASPLVPADDRRSMESRPPQIVDPFDAPVGRHDPGDDGRYRDPEGKLHQQAEKRICVPRSSEECPEGKNDDPGRRETAPIEMDAEF